MISTALFATHNRAGEITIEQTGDLSIKATITTYTKTSSVAADKDSLEIIWGDGSTEWLVRSNGNGEGEPLENDIKFNVYIGTHTYPGRATYKIGMIDPNRNGLVLNLNNGNSDQIAFYLETTFTFLNPQFQAYNNSPLLLQPPVDVGYVGQPFIHNPNAFDQEGDSLAYEWITPSMAPGQQATGYIHPHYVQAGVDNQITFNEVTGDFYWDAPQQIGEYNIAILIKEYREGELISSIVRDMQIRILEGNNMPPEIETIDEICVIAGDTVHFTVTATDPDIPEQLVELTALGGPLSYPNQPATFAVPMGFQTQPVKGVFNWVTPCEAISDQYYTVVFKAEDNFSTSQDTFGLSTLKTVRIKVVAPPPQDLQANLESGYVDISWENPYLCEDAANDFFQGFSIWRRNSSMDVPLDTCNPELTGYELLVLDWKEIQNGRYTYRDNTVERGKNYCYRILGEFARTSQGGNPYNRVKSLRSEEICVQLERDIPLITHVSVLETDVDTGQVEIRWSKPLADDLDTIVNAPPYKYELYRGEGMNPANMMLISSFTSNSYWAANDTAFIDNNLNTKEKAYSYKVAFYVNGETDTLGETNQASSVYLSIVPSDATNTLTWEQKVPWENTAYHIYRRDNATGVFDSISTTTNETYRDEGLNNEEEYCYYIKSKGTYSLPNIIDPIFNLSQIQCAIPIDDTPPCPPVLQVFNNCDEVHNTTLASAIENALSWTNPNETCEDTDDVAGYNIYYSPNENTDFVLLTNLNGENDTTYTHQPSEMSVAGCYVVTAIDAKGNESERSNVICLDNCPYYSLPNVFTPNGDGDNDLFIPFPYRYIAKIDLKIYDRWGGLVFATQDPDINWNGTNLQGEKLPTSAYFYVCKVFEQRINGVVEQAGKPLSGYIHILE